MVTEITHAVRKVSFYWVGLAQLRLTPWSVDMEIVDTEWLVKAVML